MNSGYSTGKCSQMVLAGNTYLSPPLMRCIQCYGEPDKGFFTLQGSRDTTVDFWNVLTLSQSTTIKNEWARIKHCFFVKMMLSGLWRKAFSTKFATCLPNNALQYVTTSAWTCLSHLAFNPPKHYSYLFSIWTQIDIPCPDWNVLCRKTHVLTLSVT